MATTTFIRQERRTKWTSDPNNKNWSENKNGFGHKLLESMGWKEGQGLGVDGTGRTTHVKSSRKTDNRGIGEKTNTSNNWLEGQDAFAALLANLNKNVETNVDAKATQAKTSMADDIKAVKRDRFYNKFRKMKDASKYSEQDMQMILGKRSTTESKSSEEASGSEDQEDNDYGVKTQVVGMSMQEYFKQRMAAHNLKATPTVSHSTAEGDDGDFGSATLGLGAPTLGLGASIEPELPARAEAMDRNAEQTGKEISIEGAVTKKKKKKEKKEKKGKGKEAATPAGVKKSITDGERKKKKQRVATEMAVEALDTASGDRNGESESSENDKTVGVSTQKKNKTKVKTGEPTRKKTKTKTKATESTDKSVQKAKSEESPLKKKTKKLESARYVSDTNDKASSAESKESGTAKVKSLKRPRDDDEDVPGTESTKKFKSKSKRKATDCGASNDKKKKDKTKKQKKAKTNVEKGC